MKLWLRSERAFGLSAVAIPRRRIMRTESPEASAPMRTSRFGPAPNPPPPPRAMPARVELKPRVENRASSPAISPRPNPASKNAVLGSEVLGGKVLGNEEKKRRLQLLDEKEVRICAACRLSQGRTQTVFGEGDVDARIFFIGEGPGENEDLQGRPFVGRAGEMLNKWIAAMGLRREEVYIANIVKCRPPGNRAPMPDEVAACTRFLDQQLEVIRPQVIITLGLPALKYMMNDPKLMMNRSRGTWRQWRGIKLMPTFHPSYVMRLYTPEVRAAVWADLQAVMAELGLPMPKSAS